MASVVIRRAAVTVSTSRADDAAFRALADVARITAGFTDARVVGGQMVAMLTTAYPTAGSVFRRTADADAAVSTEVASEGVIHESLLAAGYRADGGNHYVTDDGRSIDLLVPSYDRFRPVMVGGRQFDAAPGLPLALSAPPILIEVDATLLSGERVECDIKVPSLEIALVLKALTLATRFKTGDLVDIHNLLHIANSWDEDEVGGWAIAEPNHTGSRGDAQVALHKLAARVNREEGLLESGVRPEVLAALIRGKVGEPASFG